MDILKLARKNIRELTPYCCARRESEGETGILMDANENAFGSPGGEGLNRYPDPLQRSLKESIAGYRETRPERVFLGNGSDEVIDLLIRAFCEPGEEEIMIMPPTYGMYRACADINAVGTVKIPLTPSFRIDRERVRGGITGKTKLIFICSPNNPTGNSFDPGVIESIIRSFRGLVVVDEAYIDLSPAQGFTGWLEEYENLVVLQTFSKAWGLAGIRLGMAFAAESLIRILNRIKPPYNVNAATQEAARQAILNHPVKDTMVERIVRERSWLRQKLEGLPAVIRVYPSETNFLLVRFRHTSAVFRYLLCRGIRVRNQSRQVHCDGCLRITVGTRRENELLVRALKDYGGSP